MNFQHVILEGICILPTKETCKFIIFIKVKFNVEI